jgi:hypothetical protein
VIFENSTCEGQPGWVFSLGDLSSFKQFNSFDGDPLDLKESGTSGGLVVETLKEGREIFVGAPSEEFLPRWTRKVLGAYLQQAFGIKTPKAALVMDPKLKPSRNLVFNIPASRFPTNEERTHFFRSVSWFLPRSRGLMLKPESISDGSGSPFIDLA